MSKFSGAPQRPQVKAPIKTEAADTLTYNAAQGWSRDVKSELFLLAVTNMVGEQTFYESAAARDTRFVELVRAATMQDPEWVRHLIPWLRNEANMRSASVVAAAEYVKAGGAKGRAVVDSAIRRADEPMEMLGYWIQTYGKPIPKPIKRGVADALVKTVNQRSAIKYGSQSRGLSMADAIELTHPKPQPYGDDPSDDEQARLFKYLLDRKGDNVEDVREYGLDIITAADQFNKSGGESGKAVTWEQESSAGQIDWNARILSDSLGYMAMLRNLRNFDEVGISDAAYARVVTRLSDPDEVARSRQFPMRFLSAYKAVKGLRWAGALDQALQLSLRNVPSLKGRTLVLIDLSRSMVAALSDRSDLERWEAAVVFGMAIANRAENADLFLYSNQYRRADPDRAILRLAEELKAEQNRGMGYRHTTLWGGTETWQTIKETWKGHDQIVLATDEQHNPMRPGYGWGYARIDTDLMERIKQSPTRMYTFNLAGYEPAGAPAGQDGMFTFGGLNDAAFKAIPLLEQGRNATWPWEQDQ